MAEAQSPRELPLDIIFRNILPRLPAKSLPHFMCVSKQWYSFLKTPSFEKLHLHQATNKDHQNNLKILVFSNDTRDEFNAIDCEAVKDGLTASQPFPFKADSRKITILASFGGLVCLGIIKRTDYLVKYFDMILWNPLTGDHKTLSKPHNSHEDLYKLYRQRAFGLYHTSYDDDFKLLCVTHDLNAYIYSLKSDAWRRVDLTEDLKRIAAYLYPPYWLWPSVTLNGKLYFFKYGDDKTRGSIIRFDTKTEKFTEIAIPCFHLFTELATPSLGNDQYHDFFSLTVLRGCIHFFVIYSKESAECKKHATCWLMDEDGNWIEEVTLPKASYIIIESLHPVIYGKQLIGSSSKGKAWKLDLTRHVIKDISWSFNPYGMYIPKRGKYIETLVSPNRR